MIGRTRIGVLVSGEGTNLSALLNTSQVPGYPAQVACVLSNRPSARALEVARRSRVTAEALPVSDFGGDGSSRDAALLERFRSAGVKLVVCAGYDRVLSDTFLAGFPDAILNVHPSLLPAFAGDMTAVEAALAYGVKVSGCTIQLLERGDTDGGPIVLQAAVPVEPGDDADSLRERIHQQEWRLLPDAVSLWCQGRLRREGRRVHVLPATDGVV
ncbi:MAG: phosphoribosylglycinamide formyltransferase [Candidatus Dormibacteria bacterium]